MLRQLWSVFESRSSCPSRICPLLSTGQFKPDWSSLYSVGRGWSEAKSGLLLSGFGVYGPQFQLLPKDRLKVCTQTHIHTCATPENKYPDRAVCQIGHFHNMPLQWEGCQPDAVLRVSSRGHIIPTVSASYALSCAHSQERIYLAVVSVTHLDFFYLTFSSQYSTHLTDRSHSFRRHLHVSLRVSLMMAANTISWPRAQAMAGFILNFLFSFFPSQGTNISLESLQKKNLEGTGFVGYIYPDACW